MKEPRWVRLETVLAAHERLVRLFGGSLGLRDLGLLESALDRPRNLLAYEEAVSIERLAAAYAFGIAKNHPFVDGNKRVAFAIACLFLAKNGKWLAASEAEAAVAMLELASGDLPEEGFAEWLTDRCESL